MKNLQKPVFFAVVAPSTGQKSQKIRDAKLRGDVERLYYGTIADEVRLSAQIGERAYNLVLMWGLGNMDATHLAAAEAAGASTINSLSKYRGGRQNRFVLILPDQFIGESELNPSFAAKVNFLFRTEPAHNNKKGRGLAPARCCRECPPGRPRSPGFR